MADKKSTFTAREIAEGLNNLLVKVSNPATLKGEGGISENRMARLREYTHALIEPTFEHVGDELLNPEELVLVFVCAALTTQAAMVLKTTKLPALEDAQKVVAKK